MIPDVSFLTQSVPAPLWWHLLIFVYSGQKIVRAWKQFRESRGS